MKNTTPTNCIRCGIEIDRGINGARKYCTPCRDAVKREADNSFWQKHERLKKPKKAANPVTPVDTYTVADVNRMAREQGLSYGQMVAKMRGAAG